MLLFCDHWTFFKGLFLAGWLVVYLDYALTYNVVV